MASGFPPRDRGEKKKKKKKKYSSKGRRLINGGGKFSLPPRTSATSLYHGSLLEERKTDELK